MMPKSGPDFVSKVLPELLDNTRRNELLPVINRRVNREFEQFISMRPPASVAAMNAASAKSQAATAALAAAAASAAAMGDRRFGDGMTGGGVSDGGAGGSGGGGGAGAPAMALGALLTRFLNFFGREFDVRRHGLSITRDDCVFELGPDFFDPGASLSPMIEVRHPRHHRHHHRHRHR